LEQGILPADDNLSKRVVLSSPYYLIREGVLYKIPVHKNRRNALVRDILRVCLVVPNSLHAEILTSCHGDINAGHFGIDRTFARLQLKYFWDTMFNDCSNFVKSCVDCCSKKHPTKPFKALLRPMPLSHMNQRWAIDLVKMPRSTKGNNWILTFMECCSRYLCAFPIPDGTAHTIARYFLEKICFTFSFPTILLSDLGANLVGEVMTEVCKLLKVKRVMTSSFHPQSNGGLERAHKTLSENLAQYVNDLHNDWDDYISAVCYAYNTAVNLDSTGYSPFFLMFGREPISPLDTVLPTVTDLTENEMLSEYIQKLTKAREIAASNLLLAQDKMKKQYDKKASDLRYSVNDLVYVYFPEVNVGGSRKFVKTYSGPYILIEQISDVNF
jgi:hypothetical protein